MKKIISALLSLTMTISLVSAVFAADAKATAAKKATTTTATTTVSKPDEKVYDGWVENYDDDFSLGGRMWKFNNWYWNNEKTTQSMDFGSMELDSNLSWGDQMLEFDFHLTNPKRDWFRFFVKGQCVLYRVGDGQVRWLETPAGELNMKTGGDYHFRCVAKGQSIKVYVSGTGIPKEKMVAEMDNNTITAGTLNFITYWDCDIDNVKVWVPEDAKQTVKNKVEMLVVGDQIPYGFLNDDGDGLVYESLNPEIAEVDENGTITGMKSGYAIIQAKTAAGKVVESKGVYCYVQATSLYFESAENTTFYVGDTIGVNAKTGPSGNYTALAWSVDNTDVVEMYGTSQKRRAFTFNKEGEATITVYDRLSGREVKETFTVLPKEEHADKSADTTFYLTGKTTETHAEIVGAHGYPKERNEASWQVLNDLGMGALRTEYGVPGEWRETGADDKEVGKEEYKDMSFEEWVEARYPGYIDIMKNSNIKTFIFPTQEKMKVEDFMESLDYMKALCDKYGKQIVVELGNEVYAIGYKSIHAKAEDYFKWAAEMADAIHAKYPDVICAVCGFDVSGETNILADPNNTETMLEANWGYTQGGRVYDWNPGVVKYKDHFDAMTIHDYFAWEYGEQMSEDDFIKAGYAWTVENQKLVASLWDRIGLPFYHTETGNLAANMFWAGGMTVDDKIRYQWQPYPFCGIRYFEQMLGMIEEGHTVSMNFHYLEDGQGFGVVWGADNSIKSPVYHNMKAMSDIIKEADTFFELDAPDADYYVMDRPFYHGKDRATMVNNVDAWGFGNKDTGVKKVVISNRTNAKQTVSVAGTQIKPTWSYGGSAEELLPDWMRNKNQTSYLMNGTWDEVVNSVKPKTYANAEAVAKYEMEPYTIMVFEVVGTPEALQNTTANKITGFAHDVMENSLALFVNKPYAYRDNRQVAVDPDNASVAPVIKNDRTLLPLRFVAESFRCDVGYDAATKGITITGDGIDIKMTVGEKDYTVNGEKKTLDVPAEVENERTLVPLRALAEALGKEVYWDARGLIAIYPPKTGFVWAADWFNETMPVNVDSIVGLFN